MAHLQASKIKRVRDASGSDGGRVDVVDCGPFPKGELNLDVRRSSGGLYSSPIFWNTRSSRMSVRSPLPLWLIGRSARIAQNPGKDGVVPLGKSFVS